MRQGYDEVIGLCNNGWIIEDISRDDDSYHVTVEDEGEVSNSPKYPSGKAVVTVNKREAEQLSKNYGVPIL